MTTVLACAASEIFEDAAASGLFEEYARECANPLLGRAIPAYDFYAKLEAAGVAQCFGAYDQGRLEGFAFLLMGPLPHYSAGRFATAESLFVAAGARDRGLGTDLMRAIEGYAKKAGCAELFYSAPVGSRLARLLFLCTDQYTNTNHIFSKRLT